MPEAVALGFFMYCIYLYSNIYMYIYVNIGTCVLGMCIHTRNTNYSSLYVIYIVPRNLSSYSPTNKTIRPFHFGNALYIYKSRGKS